MENFFKLCIILYIVHILFALQYNPGCISKSILELEDEHADYDDVGWPWSELHIGAWVPESFNIRVLDISIAYKGIAHEEANENIMIFRNKTVVTNGETIYHETLQHSWAGFKFSIDSHVLGFYKLDDHQPLFALQLVTEIESIVIEGSNLTKNCPQGFPIWWVINSDKTVPLDSSASSYNFTFHATTPFSPTFRFERQDSKIIFGMSNSTKEVSTVHADAKLPAHIKHNISIICSDNHVCDCYECEILNSNENGIGSFQLPKKPNYVKVSRRKQDSEDFLLTLHIQKYLENEGIIVKTDEWWIAFVLALAAFLILLAVVVLTRIYKKHKKRTVQDLNANLQSSSTKKDDEVYQLDENQDRNKYNQGEKKTTKLNIPKRTRTVSFSNDQYNNDGDGLQSTDDNDHDTKFKPGQERNTSEPIRKVSSNGNHGKDKTKDKIVKRIRTISEGSRKDSEEAQTLLEVDGEDDDDNEDEDGENFKIEEDKPIRKNSGNYYHDENKTLQRRRTISENSKLKIP